MKKFLLAVVVLFSVAQSFATTWTVVNSGSFFSPDSITITQGDTVLFSLQASHNALEVSQATWNVNGNTSNGGFNTPFGGGTVTGLTAGTYYYVCANHFFSGMKGRIVVQPAVDPTVEFVITSSSYSEGIISFQLAVAITNPNSNSTSVDVNVLGGGTATFGTDFTFSPLTVTFPANSTLAEFVTVNIADDILVEGSESFTFQLNFPSNNATIGTNYQHSVTIIDNDTLRFDITPPSQGVNENAGVLTVPVSLSNISPNSTSVTVHLESIGTTASQGADFSFNDTILTWLPGSFGPILVPVTVFDDTLYEPNEVVRLKLVNATNGASFLNDTFRLVIQNNDARPPAPCSNIFFSEYIEGSSNNRALEIYNPTLSPVDLSNYRIYKSNDGGSSSWTFDLTGMLPAGATYICAHPSSDSMIASIADTLDGFFDFSGNDALVLIQLADTIDIIGQLGIDPGTNWPLTVGSTEDHTLIRSYYNYEGGTNWSTVADSWHSYPNNMFDSLGFHHIAPCGTIEPIIPAYIHFIVLSDTVSESTGTVGVIVQIDNPNLIHVSYLLARNDNAATALPGADYNFANQNFSTNTGGTTFDTVFITVLEDQLIEPVETVVLNFLNLSRGTTVIQDSTFTLYIRDNDTLTASFLGAGFSYVEKDTLVAVKVFLSTFPTTPMSVNVSLDHGSADSLVDFIFKDTVLVFPANSTDTQNVWIFIMDDNIAETNEQINFNLTDTNGLRIGILAYTLTIIDNDSIVGISQIDLENGVKMFPNPVINTLNIHTQAELLSAEVTDLLGNILIRIGKLGVGRNSIDVSSLPAGMYFVNVRDEQKVFSKRFIKQD